MKQEYDFADAERGKFFREGAISKLPPPEEEPDWAAPSEKIGKYICEEVKKRLHAYEQQPKDIIDHAQAEQNTTKGGCAHRQLYELVQNSADALLNSEKDQSILIRLTKKFLYCADNGHPIDENDIDGLMFDRMSSKRNSKAISRFGRGFKSVLGIAESPEFYSISGSFRLDRRHAEDRLKNIALASEHYPVLRLPEPIDPYEERADDADLQELMSWATNIVRLPLMSGVYDALVKQIQEFPPEFLLFVEHVRHLTLEHQKKSQTFVLKRKNEELQLDTGKERTNWKFFELAHKLSSNARADWHLHGDGEEVNIAWAVPLESLIKSGKFWAFFPTETSSLVAGILNAPWKTNEDRQNLLPGPYNEELIDAAAQLIANNLTRLSTSEDPAKHLDALPRCHEKDDSNQVDLLRKHLFIHLEGQMIVPDQNGNACGISDIKYTPKELMDESGVPSLERWFEYPDHPCDWLHHTAITRNRRDRIAAINRFFPSPPKGGEGKRGAPWETIRSWLEALVENKKGDAAVRGSRAAICVAASINREKIKSDKDYGRIILAANGDWKELNPDNVFLPNDFLNDDDEANAKSLVHPELASDPETNSALQKLGLKPLSPDSSFKPALQRIMNLG